ncbi:MAG: thioredoxin domain-containing protein [Bacteroidales bacterium]|jgi:thioredoxin-related protein
MKKIVLFLIMLISSQLIAQNKGVKFEEIGLQEALIKAKGENKMVFLDCYTVWCGPCKDMVNNVFPLEIMGNFFNKNFISLKMDMEKGNGIKIREQYNIQAFPTYLIFESDGELVNRISGHEPAEIFIAKVKKAMDKTSSPFYLKALYEKDKTNYILLFSYLDALREAADINNYTNVLYEWVKSLPVNLRYNNPAIWSRYFEIGLIYCENDLFNLVLEDISWACKYIGKEQVYKTLSTPLYYNVLQKVLGKEVPENEYQKAKERVMLLKYFSGDDMLKFYTADIALYKLENNKDKIVSVLDFNILKQLSESEISSIERMVLNIQGYNEEQKEKIKGYFKSKNEANKKRLELEIQSAEKLFGS